MGWLNEPGSQFADKEELVGKPFTCERITFSEDGTFGDEYVLDIVTSDGEEKQISFAEKTVGFRQLKTSIEQNGEPDLPKDLVLNSRKSGKGRPAISIEEA